MAHSKKIVHNFIEHLNIKHAYIKFAIEVASLDVSVDYKMVIFIIVYLKDIFIWNNFYSYCYIITAYRNNFLVTIRQPTGRLFILSKILVIKLKVFKDLVELASTPNLTYVLVKIPMVWHFFHTSRKPVQKFLGNVSQLFFFLKINQISCHLKVFTVFFPLN